VTGPGSTRTPITYTHLTLEPAAVASTELPGDHDVLVYPMVGSVVVGGRTLAEGELGLLGPGDRVELEGPSGSGDAVASEVLVLSGRPLREPVARYGPFVMNTRQQLIEAMDDFQAGRFTA
jgi:redox-sensitive bicupin YhaK (pirin superfamily)